tara:strand:+ start:1460 stop:2224 length:765 start_codon:yes stop_codon:yes gene_type:complete
MTTIKEIDYDKPINISKYEFTCDDIDDSIPEPLPKQGGFAFLIIGKPGMGKTTLILSLICKQGKAFNRKFDRVYLWSPSLITMKDDPFELIPDDQKFEDVSIDNITSVLEDIKDSGEKILFIFDDVIADIRGKGKGAVENLLQKIFFNRRHLAGAGGSVSIIASSQTWNKIDPKLRKTASQIVFYKNLHKRETESLFDEVILLPKKEYGDTLRHVFKKKHDFLYIDTTQEPDKMLHRNFTRLEINSPNISDQFF